APARISPTRGYSLALPPRRRARLGIALAPELLEPGALLEAGVFGIVAEGGQYIVENFAQFVAELGVREDIITIGADRLDHPRRDHIGFHAEFVDFAQPLDARAVDRPGARLQFVGAYLVAGVDMAFDQPRAQDRHPDAVRRQAVAQRFAQAPHREFRGI